MFYINEQQMDIGRIGCSTASKGSGGVLGNMEPSSTDDFLARITYGAASDGSYNMEPTAPFKLQEDYYKCLPKKMNAFFESLGIGMGWV